MLATGHSRCRFLGFVFPSTCVPICGYLASVCILYHRARNEEIQQCKQIVVRHVRHSLSLTEMGHRILV